MPNLAPTAAEQSPGGKVTPAQGWLTPGSWWSETAPRAGQLSSAIISPFWPKDIWHLLTLALHKSTCSEPKTLSPVPTKCAGWYKPGAMPTAETALRGKTCILSLSLHSRKPKFRQLTPPHKVQQQVEELASNSWPDPQSAHSYPRLKANLPRSMHIWACPGRLSLVLVFATASSPTQRVLPLLQRATSTGNWGCSRPAGVQPVPKPPLTSAC